jgi:hypothetical protein
MHGGTIWKATKTVICRKANNSEKERRLVVEEGEFCEFRYVHNAHFRVTELDGDDLYLFLSGEDFLNSFRYIGKVFEDIRLANRNSLKEIISCRLFKEEE